MVANIFDVEVLVVTGVCLQNTYHGVGVGDCYCTFWGHVGTPETTVRSWCQLRLVYFNYVGCVDFFNNELGDPVSFLDSAIFFAVGNDDNPYLASVVYVDDACVNCNSFLAC